LQWSHLFHFSGKYFPDSPIVKALVIAGQQAHPIEIPAKNLQKPGGRTK